MPAGLCWRITKGGFAMAKSHPEQLSKLGNTDLSRISQWARHTVASFVLLACLISLGIIVQNQYGARLAAALVKTISAIDLSHFIPLTEESPPATAVAAVDPNDGKYRVIGEYLARRYRVSLDVTSHIVAKAHAAGAELKLDPLLILAVISVESRFNPIAESTMGAKGLMQVIPRFHSKKFEMLGGEKVAFEPAVNIMVGAQILKEYIRRTGDVGDALQMYVGASTEDNENGYSSKVIAERDRLQYVLRQYLNQQRAAPSVLPAKTPQNRASI
jgi:soluble lytic murein transglycosylase-like protein